KAIWNILTQEGYRSNVVGWWASHPAEPINGGIVTNHFNGIRFVPQKGWQVAPGTIHPKDKTQFYGRFRVSPNELTEAHILPFIPNAAKIDQQKDKRLGTFAKVLSDCASIHAVATAMMEMEPWDFMAVYYDAIDHFSHAFMYYHPPKMSNISDDDFEMYKDVIKGAYKFHDMMLERLLDLAGPECVTILCSDHGFQSRHLRPLSMPREPAGPAAWHRQFGIVAVNGPGIKKDELIFGASLIDIGPTVLSLFDLPIGKDMDGRPLVEIYESPPEVREIGSWEDVPGECGMHPPGTELSRNDAEELMNQFVALGYIEDPGDDKEKAAENADIESKYNLARQLLWLNQADKALALAKEIVERRSWETRFIILLAKCLLSAGYMKMTEELVERAYPQGANIPGTLLVALASAAEGMGNREAALRIYRRAEQTDAQAPGLHIQLGDFYLRMARFDDAERAYKMALAIHEDSSLAWQGLSTVYRRRGDNEMTAEAALNAVGRIHRSPMAHFNLGVALARSGDPERAEVAFQTALKFRPSMLNAHRWLHALYRSELQDADKAQAHLREVRRIQSNRNAKSGGVTESRTFQRLVLPEIPPPEERLRRLDEERPVKRHADSESSGREFVLVSGLPRSGTSLMMQMLEAGGMAIATDGERAADIDNPKGYYEWEAIKQIAKKPEILDEEGLDTKAIKAISMLLPHLPQRHQYKVIFMTRPVEEIAASQYRMIDRLGTHGANLSEEDLRRGLAQHRAEAMGLLTKREGCEFLAVDYPTLVGNPQEVIPKIIEFLGVERLPNASAMAAVVDPSLHRQKKA
ncbi:MAG: alkaline phosphatase family protein, partial [Phycisphaerales bacterium]|nr:alkaline phosphatase family protein [Phycisphaerales bacterium]